MKEALRELRKPAVQEAYDTIIIDTATIAWEKVEDFICVQNKVSTVAEIAWGRGFKLCAKEFSKTFQEISMLGYGIVFLAHAEEKKLPGGTDDEVFVSPMLEKRAYRIINGMVDIIGYIDIDYESGKRYLQTRSTKTIVAGCRFEYMPDRIELRYDILVNALAEAIEKKGQSSGGLIIDEKMKSEKKRPFKETMDEAAIIWSKLFEMDESEEMIKRVSKIIENNFGQEIKLSSVSEEQQDILELTIEDLKDLL